MGWSIGFDVRWQRDIGYGVPAYCDHPKCHAEIDRGLGYVCGGEAFGGDRGCGLYFCDQHGGGRLCPRCAARKPPYKRTKSDHPDWTRHKATDPSWAAWRAEQAATTPSGRQRSTGNTQDAKHAKGAKDITV